MADSEKTIRLKIELEIARAKSNIKGLESQIEKLDMRFTKNKVKAKQLAVEYDKLANSKSRLSQSSLTLEQSSTNVSTKLNQVKNASGGATASVLEMGRVISDSNYGIRGVANNLSQLATNMMFTAKSAGGFGAGLAHIGKTLMGPLGLLLLFQTGIALLEKWSMSSNNAKTDTDKLTESIEKQNEELKQNIALRKMQIQDVINFLNNPQIINEYKSLLSDLTGNYLDKEAALTELSDRFAKIGFKDSKLLKDQNIMQSDRVLIAVNLIAIQEQTLKLEEERARVSKAISQQKEIEKDFNEGNISLAMKNKKLQDVDFVGLKKTIGLQKVINELNKQNQEIIDKTVVIKTKKTTGKGKEEKILPIDPIFGQDIDDLIEGYDKSINLNLQYQRKLNKSRAFLSDEQKVIQSEKNRELLEEEIAHNEKMLLADMANGEGSMEVIERKNTINNLMIDLRNSDLDHELMIIEQKKNAQMEYANYVASIGNILARISGKNKEMALAALLVQKGAAIANVVVKNNEANAAIMLKAKSDASQAITGGSLDIAKSASAFASGNVVQGAALAASGNKSIAAGGSILAQGAAAKTKNNISAGMSIASILAATLSSRSLGGSGSSGSGSGGAVGGGGGESREFDFNLVGSTGINQLAEGVAGQFGQPIQAYVVSSQISSQQQLDGIIQSNATIGD